MNLRFKIVQIIDVTDVNSRALYSCMLQYCCRWRGFIWWI